MRLEDLGLIGNCQCSALVERSGRIVWCALPQFDSEPVFGQLLDDDGGAFGIGPAAGGIGEQRYLRNSNILETVFEARDGRFRVLDFAPRWSAGETMHRPPRIERLVEPLAGAPEIRVQCDPRRGWSRVPAPARAVGRGWAFDAPGGSVHFSASAPLSAPDCVIRLTQREAFAVQWGTGEPASVAASDAGLTATLRYWQRWVKHCNIPPIFQSEVIRSALALKLHCFEPTGAIVAAMTTSIPEFPGSGRTWDYRYCWLRDSYYVLDALRLLGHFEEREGFLQYLLDIGASAPFLELQPLYRIDGGRDIPERTLSHWAGFNGDGPVRVGNAAAAQQQHDVYGELVLALSPIFLDERFEQERTPHALELLERLARRAVAVAGTPDAGIWEYRREARPQTFSSLMCWAAADRMAGIGRLYRLPAAEDFRLAAARIHAEVGERAWNTARGAFAGEYGGEHLDAALLQMAPLRFLPPGDARLRSTIRAIQEDLGRDGWLLRYRDDDGLGVPSLAFLICTFWLVEALGATGAPGEARAILQRLPEVLSPLGLMSEHCETTSRRLWGNFPQAYSHVGLIHAAFAAAPRWPDFA